MTCGFNSLGLGGVAPTKRQTISSERRSGFLGLLDRLWQLTTLNLIGVQARTANKNGSVPSDDANDESME
jgi:hypothetical protein